MYYNKFTNDRDILTHPNFYQKVYKKNNKPPRIINMKTYYQKKTTKKLSYNNNINTKKYYEENDDEYYFKKIKNSRILKKDSFEEKSTFYKSTLSNNYSTTSLENNNLSICSTILKTDESKNSIKEEKNINKNFNFSSTQPIQNNINQSQIISNNQNNQNLCNLQLFSIKNSPNPILENTEILSINVKISENKFSTFKLRRYDDLFITVKLFCEINKIDEKLIKPIIIKVLSCLNCIYKIMNCNLLNDDINILKEIKRTNY